DVRLASAAHPLTERPLRGHVLLRLHGTEPAHDVLRRLKARGDDALRRQPPAGDRREVHAVSVAEHRDGPCQGPAPAPDRVWSSPAWRAVLLTRRDFMRKHSFTHDETE